MVEGKHWRVTWPVAVLILALVIGLAAPWIWGIPERLHPPLTQTELRDVPEGQRLERQQEQRRLQNDVRSVLVQGLVGLLALTGAAIGASVAWRQLQENRRQQQGNEELSRKQLQLSREQLQQAISTSQDQLRLTQEELRLTRESQITERFTRAIEQLGSDKLDVRLGGIYALERLAHDSPERDHRTVVEVLSAFVREGSRKRGTRWPGQERAQEVVVESGAPALGTDTETRPATDIQAALTVLGRLPQRQGIPRGDLSEAQLSGTRLGKANLSRALLRKANLSRALLYGVNLSGAQLGGADLSGALLYGVNLSGALLARANLSEAQLEEGTDLSGAQLFLANLSDAQLGGANLSGAQLVGADLSGAKLVDTVLTGANLTQAIDLTQAQLDAARGDGTTRLPDGVQRPISWATGEESVTARS